MSDNSFLGKLGNWFKRGSDQADLPLVEQSENGNGLDHHRPGMEPRSTFLRPWAKRDAAIANLQDGFNTLTGLMGSIRDNLETQNGRQQELMSLLSRLPESLEGLPEASRVQSETLKAIHTQLATQNGHQTKLADILDHISQASSDHRKTLQTMDERFNTLSEHDAAISHNLSSVGNAMQTVSRNSSTSAEVLNQMKENITARDGELERILHRQGTRFTTMLSVAIFLSVAALVACSVIGYLGYQALGKMK